MAANRVSYKKYQREKERLRKRKAGRRVEDIAADTLDWTVDEIEKFWAEHDELLKLEELLKFHPSGAVNE
jgi:DNA repair ATPase RecN